MWRGSAGPYALGAGGWAYPGPQPGAEARAEGSPEAALAHERADLGLN